MASFNSSPFINPNPVISGALSGLGLNTTVPKPQTIGGGLTGTSAQTTTPTYNALLPTSQLPSVKTTQGAAFPAPTPQQQSLISNPTPSPAPSPTPTPTSARSFQTPNGGTVTTDASGAVTGFQQAPSYQIGTGGSYPSEALNSGTNFQQLSNTRNQYADYLQGLAQATQPNAQYIQALTQYQNAQLGGQQIQADFLTNPSYPGDTYGFAQGVAGRQTALNSLQQTAASNNLAVQEAIRSGNISAYQALVSGTAPQTLGYGQQLESPLGGAPIAQGQTQPSYSAIASPFGGYLSYDQRTGQYTQIGADQAYGGTGTGQGTSGQAQIPAFLQPAIQNVAGQQYIDMSKISPAQLPYAQQIAAQNGIPLLSTDDANKLQETQQAVSGAQNLLTTITNNAQGLITANSTIGAIAQAAQLNAQALIPGTQAKLYKDTVGAFLSQLSRASGERGVLTDADVARISAALPSFSDTTQIAAQKAQQLNTVFSTALQGAVSAYLGTNTPQGGQGSQSSQGSGQVNIGGSNFVLQNGKWVVGK